jgi:hypothetical protein
VLNPQKRRIFRRRISPWENASAAILVGVVLLATTWILLQRDNYDPAERDISLEALQEGSLARELYHTPLKTWVEPGSAPAGAAGPDLGIFPATLLDGGWALRGRVETYDPDNLYEKINGAAEQYLSFGFQRLHYLTLEEEERSLILELYDQSRFRNALGIFAAQRDGSREVLGSGSLCYYPTSVGAVGIHGNYLFKIAGSEASGPMEAKTEQLLEVVAGLPTAPGGGSEVFALFTGPLSLPFESVAYQRQDVFQYDFLGDVWFGSPDGAGEARYFVHRAESPEEAASLYGQLAEEQGYEYEVVERDGGGALFRHEFLETFFAARHRGGWLYGVDGAGDRATAERLLSRLDEALHG